MKNDKITVSNESIQSFDKMQLALAIRNSTWEDNLSCFLLLNGILLNCKDCSLKLLCDEIDGIAEKYTKQTTKVVNSFNFHE